MELAVLLEIFVYLLGSCMLIRLPVAAAPFIRSQVIKHSVKPTFEWACFRVGWRGFFSWIRFLLVGLGHIEVEKLLLAARRLVDNCELVAKGLDLVGIMFLVHALPVELLRVLNRLPRHLKDLPVHFQIKRVLLHTDHRALELANLERIREVIECSIFYTLGVRDICGSEA